MSALNWLITIPAAVLSGIGLTVAVLNFRHVKNMRMKILTQRAAEISEYKNMPLKEAIKRLKRFK